MKNFNLLTAACIVTLIFSCTSKQDNQTPTAVSYPYKATYSSDISMSSNTDNLQRVLKIWKCFETDKFDSMQHYYADTVTYKSANGPLFHGSSTALLDYAKKDVEGLDSMRFDISMWQNIHINDRNEDWVYIWAAERRYNKDGTADTSLMHEQWQLKNGKVVYFNQYLAKEPK